MHSEIKKKKKTPFISFWWGNNHFHQQLIPFIHYRNHIMVTTLKLIWCDQKKKFYKIAQYCLRLLATNSKQHKGVKQNLKNRGLHLKLYITLKSLNRPMGPERGFYRTPTRSFANNYLNELLSSIIICPLFEFINFGFPLNPKPF